MKNRVGFLLALVLLIALTIPLHSPFAVAGTRIDWPEKGRPVTIVVPFPPGGGADIAARASAAMLERDLGTPFIVTSKPGAGSQVGNTFVSMLR